MLEEIPLLFLKRSVAGLGLDLFLFRFMSIESTPPLSFAKSSLLADSLFIDEDAPGAALDVDDDDAFLSNFAFAKAPSP